ncbi:ATP-binding protein [Ferroplasma sp.]|uniref:ATP-binding protein n=1 Tax=Ferroplasma sp. TaxID=2591003 RepID=UPI0026327FBB|nr:ATP-binding protein [Ferroplasma sp.]
MATNNFLENIALKLSPKVLQHISSNIYRDNASAFKELASNSFDAGATEFEIILRVSNVGKSYNLKEIIVKDNGSGMDREDFKYILMNIGFSKKVRDLEYDSLDKFSEEYFDRPIIGRIGIGMFSIVSASNQFSIESKIKGQDFALSAKVDLPNFTRLTTTNFELENFEAGTASLEKIDPSEDGKSYTKIVISNFKKPFLENLMDNFNRSKVFNVIKNLNGNEDDEKVFTELLDKLTDTDNIDNMDSKIDVFLYNVALMLPIEYLSNGPFKECVKLKSDDDESQRLIEDTKERLKKYHFSAFLKLEIEGPQDHINFRFKLFKPISFPTHKDIEKYGIKALEPTAFLYKKHFSYPNELGDMTSADISMYAYRQAKRISPITYRGILFRVYDVAIGKYEYDKLKPYSATVLQFQTSYELFMERGFQSAVNIDRESLFEGSYAYRIAKTFFNYVLGKTDSELKNGASGSDKNLQEETISQSHNDEFESKFTEYLNKEFSKPYKHPLLKELNNLKAESTAKSKERKNELEASNPLVNILMGKYNLGDSEITKAVYLPSEQESVSIEKESDRLIIKIPKKYGKDVRIMFNDILAASNTILDPESRSKFLSFLDELYDYYLHTKNSK